MMEIDCNTIKRSLEENRYKKLCLLVINSIINQTNSNKQMPTTRKRERKVYAEEDYETDEEEEEDDEPPAKKVKTSSLGTWESLHEGSLLVFTPNKFEKPAAQSTIQIVSFDFDSTLVDTKSGRAFATGPTDWKLWNASVKKKLIELNQDKQVVLMIFTNQNGIAKGKLSENDFHKRMEGFLKEIGEDVPIVVFAATKENHFRKPATGMWEYMEQDYLDIEANNIQIDKANSIYVGDAAGRPKGWEKSKKKDHSCGDRKFALNCGIKFATPEAYFLKQAEYKKWELGGLDIKQLENQTKKEYNASDLISSKQEVVVFVGFPASGKSTFFKRYFEPNGYVHINRDTLGTPAKCLKACKEALGNGKSVVVDNTNPTESGREPYIQAAKDAGVPVRCFRFTTDEQLAKHLNTFRENITNGEHKHVPGVGYNTYKKNLEEPSKSEGFTEVRKIDFVPVFSDENTKAKFFHYT
jgi:bifunctional polynucleotide phosphatase/kinase